MSGRCALCHSWKSPPPLSPSFQAHLLGPLSGDLRAGRDVKSSSAPTARSKRTKTPGRTPERQQAQLARRLRRAKEEERTHEHWPLRTKTGLVPTNFDINLDLDLLEFNLKNDARNFPGYREQKEKLRVLLATRDEIEKKKGAAIHRKVEMVRANLQQILSHSKQPTFEALMRQMHKESAEEGKEISKLVAKMRLLEQGSHGSDTSARGHLAELADSVRAKRREHELTLRKMQDLRKIKAGAERTSRQIAISARREFEQEVINTRKEQLVYMYESPWFLPKRVTDFFLISAHGRFGRLGERRDRVHFDNNAKFFFRIPPGFRLIFPSLGQGCLAIGNTRAEQRLWELLAAKKSSVFFEPPSPEDKTLRPFLEHARLFEAGDLFPNFVLSFEDEEFTPVFDVFSIVDFGHDTVHLSRNGWSSHSAAELELNAHFKLPLGRIVDFFNGHLPAPAGQVVDIVLSCCNVLFECPDKDLEARVRMQWEVLMREGKERMEEARGRRTGVVTRGRALRENLYPRAPPAEGTISYEDENALLEVEDGGQQSRQIAADPRATRRRLFTKKNCICTEPCKNGKCRVDPGLCPVPPGQPEDEVWACEADESTGARQVQGAAARESPSPMDSSGD